MGLGTWLPIGPLAYQPIGPFAYLPIGLLIIV